MPDEKRLEVLGRLHDAIRSYFESSRRNGWPISVLEGIRQVQQAVPDSGVSREDLSELIVDYAITHGFNVTFDGKEPESSG